MCLTINILYNNQHTKVNILRKEDENGNIKKDSNCFKIYQISSLLEQYIMTSFLNKDVKELDIVIKEKPCQESVE